MEVLISACNAISNGAKCATKSAVNYLRSFVGIPCTHVSGSKAISEPRALSSPLCLARGMTPERSLHSVLFLLDDQSFKLITRLAGFSGFVAIVLSAYGSNVLSEEAEEDQLRRKALHRASKHHFIHTFGLLHCSKASYPYLTAMLFSSGMVVYCGICYEFAIRNGQRFRKYTPIGGYLFMLGWCSFIL